VLKPTGVIIVAIDHNEQAHLKLLMDDVFEPRARGSGVLLSWN
jgi:adenine specific DNA methylase Mod